MYTYLNDLESKLLTPKSQLLTNIMNITKIINSEKEEKNMQIYDMLLEKKQISRSDISQDTGINVVSISNYMNSFISKHLIVEKKIGESSGGRPPILLELDKRNNFFLGIFAKIRSVKFVLVDVSLSIVKEHEEKVTNAGDVYDVILDQLRTFSAEYNKGIGSACIVFENETDHKSSGKNKLEDFIDKAKSLSGVKQIYIEKPAIAGCYAEHVLNTKSKKMIFSYKDTGECILMHKNCIYTWEDINFENSRYLKPWNKHMSIECFAKAIIDRGIGTEILLNLKGASNVSQDAVIGAALHGDAVALEILEFAGLSLGIRIAYLINIYRPEIVVIGGGIEKADKFFVVPLKKSVEKLASIDALKKVSIVSSKNNSTTATCVGAAALCVREIFLGV